MSTPGDLYNNLKAKYQNYIAYILQKLREFEQKYSDVAKAILNIAGQNVKNVAYTDTDIVYPAVMADPGQGVWSVIPPKLSLKYDGPVANVGGFDVPYIPQFEWAPPLLDAHGVALLAMARTVTALAPPGVYTCEYSDSYFTYCNLDLIDAITGPTGLNIARSIVIDDPIANRKITIPQGANFDGDQKITLRRDIGADYIQADLMVGVVDADIDNGTTTIPTKLHVMLLSVFASGNWSGYLWLNKICPIDKTLAVFIKGLGAGGRIVCN